ncbi:MAG TPA: GNAT family N-acetyltransferase [Trebonia sp.]|jgi:predicted acetyltransferase|nr:GNAT family N-acetyltransferase [Trebonia sp.]
MTSPARTCAPHSQSPGQLLRLRPLREDDEATYRGAHEVMAAEDFPFGFGLEPGMTWDGYLQMLDDHRHGLNLPDHLVPATFLVAEVDGTIVGRASIRHQLNDFLAHEGGHIGYCVLPDHRRRGYATEILRQSLTVIRAIGVDRVLIFCDDDNAGSAAVIERCGGGLESVFTPGPARPLMRRYWIE